MQITLYKDCKLNNKYQNVLALCNFGSTNGTRLIEKYLSTLTKTTLAIDCTYQDGIGTLVFDYNSSTTTGSYVYNYMKVENTFADGSTILRYCFIDSIVVKNDICYLDYSEDIWHSYGYNTWSITKSYLSRSRLANSNYYSNLRCIPYNLPVEYNGNNNLIFDDFYTSEKYNIVAEVQWYSLATSGTSSNRYSNIFMLSDSDDNTSFTIEDARATLSALISNSSSEKAFRYTFTGGDTDWYYCISKIWIIPEDLGLYNNFGWGLGYSIKIGSGYQWSHRIYTDHNFSTTLCHLHLLENDQQNEMIKLSTYTIDNDFRQFSIGMLGHQIPVVNNGTKHNVSFYALTTITSFKLIMSIDNEHIDVTELLYYEFPYDVASSEVVQQQRLARTMQGWNTLSNVASFVGGMEMPEFSTELIHSGSHSISSNLNMQGKSTNSGFYHYRQGKLQRFGHNFSGGKKGSLSETHTYTDYKTLEKPNGTGSGLSSFGESIIGLYGLIAPVYSTTKKATGITGAFENARHFLCGYTIDPDNEVYVNECINNDGYVVYEIVTDLWKTGIKGQSFTKPFFDNGSTDYAFRMHKYNTVKFENINIYGHFPRDIAVTLEDILENGTKVWFDYNAIQ